MLFISFHLLLDLLQLLISEFYHLLLLFYFLYRLLEVTLDLVKSRELLLYLVFLSCDVLDLLHELSILLCEVLKVSL